MLTLCVTVDNFPATMPLVEGRQWDSQQLKPAMWEEFGKIIKQCMFKRYDIDPCPTEHCETTLEVQLPYLKAIVNSSLQQGMFPLVVLRTALVMPLLKKERLDTAVFANYGYVSNIPIISKVLEKVVISRLMTIWQQTDSWRNSTLHFAQHRDGTAESPAWYCQHIGQKPCSGTCHAGLLGCLWHHRPTATSGPCPDWICCGRTSLVMVPDIPGWADTTSADWFGTTRPCSTLFWCSPGVCVGTCHSYTLYCPHAVQYL